MSKVSKPVWVLVIVAILAVGVAVVGLILVGTVLESRRQIRVALTARRIRALDAAIQQYKNPPGIGDYPQDASAEVPPAETPGAESPNAEAPTNPTEDDERPEAKVRVLGEGVGIVVTRSGPGRVEVTFSTSPKAEADNPPRPATMVPSQRQVRKLALTDEQKEQVEAYDNEFRPLYDARREDLKLRWEAAFQAVNDAQEAEDTQAEATARQGIRNMMGEQGKVMKQLDDQYLEGLRPILTKEQAGELDMDRIHPPAGPTLGYMERQGPDGLSTFKVIEPMSGQ